MVLVVWQWRRELKMTTGMKNEIECDRDESKSGSFGNEGEFWSFASKFVNHECGAIRFVFSKEGGSLERTA